MPSGSVAIVESDLGSALMAGEQRILIVTDADAALDRVPRTLLAVAHRDSVNAAIDRYRAARTPRALGRAFAASAAAIAGAIVAVFLVLRARRRLRVLLEERLAARIGAVRIGSFHVVEGERIAWLLGAAVRVVEVATLAVVAVVATEFVLGSLPWTRALAADVLPYLLAPLRGAAAGIWAALPGVVYVIVIVLVTRWVLRLAHLFFAALEAGTVALKGFERDWTWPTYRIFRLGVVALAAVTAYPHVPGSNTGAFKGISILMGVVLSLGSSSFVANIIAGYALTYRRPFRIGDRVKFGETIGYVEEIRVTQTRVRTPKNEIVVIPNSSILSGEVLNYSALAATSGLIVHTTVGIGYETPWRQVEAMLILAAERTPAISREPRPFVLEKALGDFCVTYELNAYCADPRGLDRLYAALHRNVLDVFNEHGVQIMTPAYEGDPAEPKIVPPGRWYEPPARPQDPTEPPAGEAPSPEGAARKAASG